MFKFSRVKDIVLRNKYILYLDSIGIETEEIINNIKTKVETDGKILDNIFSNTMYKMLSPNIFLENIIFEEVNKFLFQNYNESVIFDEEICLDVKSIIATQNSIIDRPNIKKPSELEEGFIKEFNIEDNFVRIAKFESEIIEETHGMGSKGQSIIFEGIIPLKMRINPLFCKQNTISIWNNSFCKYEINLVGLCSFINSIESNHVLWLNSELINEFSLKLDDFNKGLRALNEDNEVILEFRQWRKDLIGNGASFVGQDSNIAKFQGCDLLLRKDYFETLHKMFPDLVIRTEKIGL